MRVDDDNNATFGGFDCIIHGTGFFSCKVLRIEHEVFVPSFLRVIVGPLNIHPEHIYWYVVVRELLITLGNAIGIYPVPFAEVVTEVVDQR